MTEDNTPQDDLETLRANLTAAEEAAEKQRAENGNIKAENGRLAKEMKTLQAKLEELQKASMSEEDRRQQEIKRLADLESALQAKDSELLRFKILSTSDHGLDPVLAGLVSGSTEEEVKASIMDLRQKQEEMAKRLGGTHPASAPPPPSPAGGRAPELNQGDIWKMTDEQFAEFKQKAGDIQITGPK